ncbi:MAG: hypothetical protein GY761_13300 [Hyphomicrobiales bacterium]|nr:hypothetical protein [Hyphomicrobiales bacterium]
MNQPQKHDAIGRRKRECRQSTGKRVTPQERDLLWFKKIHQHGPLSSTYLHAFSKHIRHNEKRSRDRLTDLFNEDQTPHGGPYLARPFQQFQTYDARYQDLIYDLTPAAEKALKEIGMWSEYATGHSGPWVHSYMVSCITASIELATMADPKLGYIPQEQILERADTALRYPVPFKNPVAGKTETKDLIPDAIFGLEYKQAGGSKYRFFIVEADRGTEPSRSSNFNRKSHLRNFLQYREYVGRGLYKDHLKLTAGMMVLNVTTNTITMSNMIKLVNELSQQGNNYLLFKTCKSFGQYFKPSKPNFDILDRKWRRSGQDPFLLR